MRVVVVGGGVVGVACALAFARRGADVELREACDALGLAASGTNSGIVHTGFDSKPGELETELILRAARLRPEVLETLDVPFEARGAELVPRGDADHATVRELYENACGNGVDAVLGEDGALFVPGEGLTDPVAFTLALAGAAVEHGARLALGAPVQAAPVADVVVNAAGLGAGRVARLFGDDSFDVHPRKGEFLVFDVAPPARILLPVPTAQTKGVLVFPTAAPPRGRRRSTSTRRTGASGRRRGTRSWPRRSRCTRRSAAPSRSSPTRACAPPGATAPTTSCGAAPPTGG